MRMRTEKLQAAQKQGAEKNASLDDTPGKQSLSWPRRSICAIYERTPLSEIMTFATGLPRMEKSLET